MQSRTIADQRSRKGKYNVLPDALRHRISGILIIGLIYGAFLLHLPAHWIVVGGIVLVGAGILSGVKATRQRDTAA